MEKDSNLSKVIASTRTVSADGSLVTYDLTKGVDFSDPKKIAEALADVFFTNDAVNWFKVTDDKIEFNPTYKVRVVMASEHSKLLHAASDDFLKDIKKKDTTGTFSKQIKDDAAEDTKLGTAMATSALKAALFRHSEDKVYTGYISDDLFTDLLENLEIRSLSDEDLINWKNLHL
ncbi:MAG: hypothetical protein QXZ44_07195 [Ferroplasma sp.]